jgi:peptidyl-prolyl cis-trans isomerase D
MPGTGYALFKLSKLDAGEKLDDQRRQSMQAQLSKLAVQEEVQTYIAALRARYKVEINKGALEVKDK